MGGFLWCGGRWSEGWSRPLPLISRQITAEPLLSSWLWSQLLTANKLQAIKKDTHVHTHTHLYTGTHTHIYTNTHTYTEHTETHTHIYIKSLWTEQSFPYFLLLLYYSHSHYSLSFCNLLSLFFIHLLTFWNQIGLPYTHTALWLLAAGFRCLQSGCTFQQASNCGRMKLYRPSMAMIDMHTNHHKPDKNKNHTHTHARMHACMPTHMCTIHIHT